MVGSKLLTKSGASFEGGWGTVAPKEKKERRELYMNNVKFNTTYKVRVFPIFQ